jgi:putative transposase
MVRYKAAEAGVVYAEAPTRQLKPSQRCHVCWTVYTKRRDERWHACPCGASCHCDVNAACVRANAHRVVLRWGMVQVSVRFSCLVVASEQPQSGTGRVPRVQNLQLDL